MKKFQYIFAILIAFMPLSAFADYTVTGVVNDEQGLPLPDAGVEVVMGGDTLMTNCTGLPQSYANVFNVDRTPSQ